MSTKKKISDIDKAIEEMQQRRDECFKHIGKAMYESCPELGDMSVADMRKAGRYLHKMLTKKVPSQGAAPCPKRRARRVRFGQHVRPGRTRAYARDGLWRGHVARQSCLLSGTPRGVSGVPCSEWDALPSRRRKLVGNGAHLGVRRGAVKTAPLASGTCNDKTKEFSTL